jgi:hypothetical protein
MLRAGLRGSRFDAAKRPFFRAYGRITGRMETKEIAMHRLTKLLGTSCVLAAALAAGPAAADQLAGFNGFADGTYTHTTYNRCGGCDDWNAGTFGVGMALPLADLPNLNWQLDGSYSHQWTGSGEVVGDCAEDSCFSTGHSQEVWNFGFSPFWAGPMSRFGLNLNYETTTHFGHITNGGGFMEWYINDVITVAAKGGYLSSGGAEFGGHGHYLAGSATFYGTPDLAISGGIDWQDIVTGFGCAFGAPCIRGDVGVTAFGIDAEFMPFDDIGASIFAGFTYREYYGTDNDFNSSTFDVGLRYYTGVAAGSLQNRHRNGNLRGFLRGP